MKQLRQHIVIIDIIWLLAVSSLDVTIPLHFFVTKHTTYPSCSSKSGSCCNQHTSQCPICNFNLYIGNTQKFSFSVKRTDILLSETKMLAKSDIVYFKTTYTSLRAPPFIYSLFI
ncbi:MAG: hypothetical protein PHH37_02515 [Paludibacter sp.]|nr:hypothetical protein [Paludibacter sp.]